jgi:hypothetical protein
MTTAFTSAPAADLRSRLLAAVLAAVMVAVLVLGAFVAFSSTANGAGFNPATPPCGAC